MKTTEQVLNHILECFGAGDAEGVLRDYTEDTVFVGPDGTIDNLAGLREFFQGFFREFGHEEAKFEMKSVQVAGDVAMITWSGETPEHLYEFGTDTWIVQDGKVTHQTWCWSGETK